MYKRKIFLDCRGKICYLCSNKVVNDVQGVKGAKDRSEYIGLRCTPEEKEKIFSEAKKRKISVTELLIGSALGIALGNAIYDAIEGKEQ